MPLKEKKAGSTINEIFREVAYNANETDDPVTKIRSMVLKTINGKRDLGQCEVSRLLLSAPLYHSSFAYIKFSLDLNNR